MGAVQLLSMVCTNGKASRALGDFEHVRLMAVAFRRSVNSCTCAHACVRACVPACSACAPSCNMQVGMKSSRVWQAPHDPCRAARNVLRCDGCGAAIRCRHATNDLNMDTQCTRREFLAQYRRIAVQALAPLCRPICTATGRTCSFAGRCCSACNTKHGRRLSGRKGELALRRVVTCL